MVIAIDGPAGSGKSSTAQLVANRLGIMHLDTGAMYRAITLKCLQNNISSDDFDSLAECLRNTVIKFTGSPPKTQIWMDNQDVTTAIRSAQVTDRVSDYCQPMVVREALVEQQRNLAHSSSVVCEGRDIGTVVFPHADLKFFMVASTRERAKRRKRDFEKIGVEKNIDDLMREITRRDEKDMNRTNSPLKKAPDAEELDTTNMTLAGQVEYIIAQAQKFINKKKNDL